VLITPGKVIGEAPIAQVAKVKIAGVVMKDIGETSSVN